MTNWLVCHRVDRFPDRLPVGGHPLQLSANQFTGVGVNNFDLQPLDAVRLGLGVVTGRLGVVTG